MRLAPQPQGPDRSVTSAQHKGLQKACGQAQRSKVTPAPAWEVPAPTCSGRKSSGHPGSILSAISRGEGGEVDTCSVPASLNFLGVGNSHCTWKPPKSLACHRGGGQCWWDVPSGSPGLQLPGERETGTCWLRPPRCPLFSRRVSGLDPREVVLQPQGAAKKHTGRSPVPTRFLALGVQGAEWSDGRDWSMAGKSLLDFDICSLFIPGWENLNASLVHLGL